MLPLAKTRPSRREQPVERHATDPQEFRRLLDVPSGPLQHSLRNAGPQQFEAIAGFGYAPELVSTDQVVQVTTSPRNPNAGVATRLGLIPRARSLRRVGSSLVF